MKTVFSADLLRQDVYATGDELTSIMGRDEGGEDLFVHTFKKPILVTDNYRISRLRPTLRDTLFTIFGRIRRTTQYDGVSVYADESHRGVWSPSIDTLLIAKALRQIFESEVGLKRAIEIGCGSGFLSKYILEKSHGLESMTVNDISPFAIKCAQDNIRDQRAFYVLGDGIEAMKGKKYDLVVCNPPYIPRPSSVEINPYEGVSILNYLVHHAQDHLNPGGLVVVGMSNLADCLVFNQPTELAFEIREQMFVPLKVNNVLNNPEWLKYLEDRNLKKQNLRGYEFWHMIKTIVAKK